ncbi:MAG: hypothetical protein KKH61_19875, partial [Gammaproteobacteria bacterium]|nr:hypothetical protein [Gammaproteobacteria bacterium]
TICWQDKTKRDGSPIPESNTTVNVRVADLLVKKTRVVGKKLSEMTVEELLAEAAKRPMTDEQRKMAERLSRPVNKDRIDGEPVRLSPEQYAEKVAQEDLAKASRKGNKQ